MPLDPSPSAWTRLRLAFLAFWRILLDPAFAASVASFESPAAPVLPAAPPSAPAAASAADGALTLLALLQREGRLVDFLEQDVAAFSDSDVGAAARAVHEGCRRALRAHTHATFAPVRLEEEGTRVTVEEAFSPDEIKLTGNVRGAAPFSGVLRHRGWRASGLVLPVAVRGMDVSVLAPAEVEL